jgi:hypothetical protein
MLGSNVLRYDHDPVTREPLGVRIEGAATNLLTNSEVVSTVRNVTVTAQAYTLAMEGAGSLALSGAYSGALIGGATRQTLTFTPSAGTLTITPSGDALRVQLETGSVASSYIVTGASIVTRAAERLYAPMPFDPAADGITLLWDGVLPASSANFPHALSLAPPSGTNPRLNFYISGATMSVVGFAAPSGFWTVGQGRPFVAGAKRRIVARLTPSALALSQNGDAVTGASLASAIPTGMTRLDLGSVNASNQWNSTISRVAVWRGAPFSDAQMRELSAL